MMKDEMIKLNPSSEELNDILKRLRLGNIRREIEQQLQRCTEAKLTPRQTVAYLLGKEVQYRAEHSIQIKTDMACFPTQASLASFDFSASNADQAQFEELAQCQWIANAQNVLLYGEPGLGKTHLAIALGRQAIVRGYSTLFIPANDLLTQLSKAQQMGTLQERLTIFCRNKLLIIDEFGFPLSGNDDWAALFYTLIAKRHEKSSTIITTNRSIKDWPHYLSGDVQCTKASIDRFMQYAIPIKLEGDSYRMRKMRQQVATGGRTDTELMRDVIL